MVSDNAPPDNQSAEKPSETLIPVQVEQVDQLVLIARDLAGFVLILDAAAVGDPTIAAVERILSEISERLQEFKNWFHDAWHVTNGKAAQSKEATMPKTQRSTPQRDAEAIRRIREILWPTSDPEQQWTPDTLDRVAEVVTPHKPSMVNNPKRLSGAEIRALYGRSAVISRKALFTLVHLDNPSPTIVRQRRREFDPAKFFCADCPLCTLLKEAGVIVFDESVFDGEES